MKIQRQFKYVQLGSAWGLRPAATYKQVLKVLKLNSNHTLLLLHLFKKLLVLSLKSLADATPMPIDYVAILTYTDYINYN